MATLQLLLASRGIYRSCELADVLECSRQMAQTYWRGFIWRREARTGARVQVPVRLGREVATRLATRLDLALEDLLRAEPGPGLVDRQPARHHRRQWPRVLEVRTGHPGGRRKVGPRPP
jgi:hypothetical protein